MAWLLVVGGVFAAWQEYRFAAAIEGLAADRSRVTAHAAARMAQAFDVVPTEAEAEEMRKTLWSDSLMQTRGFKWEQEHVGMVEFLLSHPHRGDEGWSGNDRLKVVLAHVREGAVNPAFNHWSATASDTDDIKAEKHCYAGAPDSAEEWTFRPACASVKEHGKVSVNCSGTEWTDPVGKRGETPLYIGCLSAYPHTSERTTDKNLFATSFLPRVPWWDRDFRLYVGSLAPMSQPPHLTTTFEIDAAADRFQRVFPFDSEARMQELSRFGDDQVAARDLVAFTEFVKHANAQQEETDALLSAILDPESSVDWYQLGPLPATLCPAALQESERCHTRADLTSEERSDLQVPEDRMVLLTTHHRWAPPAEPPGPEVERR